MSGNKDKDMSLGDLWMLCVYVVYCVLSCVLRLSCFKVIIFVKIRACVCEGWKCLDIFDYKRNIFIGRINFMSFSILLS